jgi:hypothetical protein
MLPHTDRSVHLVGFELILNQVYGTTQNRAGHGRAFIGLEEHQAPALIQHVRERGLNFMRTDWGRPTIVLRGSDGNELFFWFPTANGRIYQPTFRPSTPELLNVRLAFVQDRA